MICEVIDYANGRMTIYFCKPYTYGIFNKYVEETDELKLFCTKVKCNEADVYDINIGRQLAIERCMTKYLKYVKGHYKTKAYKYYELCNKSKEKLDQIDRKLSNLRK